MELLARALEHIRRQIRQSRHSLLYRRSPRKNPPSATPPKKKPQIQRKKALVRISPRDSGIINIPLIRRRVPIVIIMREGRELRRLGDDLPCALFIVFGFEEIDFGRAAASAVRWAGVVFPRARACTVQHREASEGKGERRERGGGENSRETLSC
jgi:hypothetical protein